MIEAGTTRVSSDDLERDELAWRLMLQRWPEMLRRDAFRGRVARFAIAMPRECWRAFAYSMWIQAGRMLGRPR